MAGTYEDAAMDSTVKVGDRVKEMAEEAANKVSQGIDGGIKATRGFVAQAGDALDTTAKYFREGDARQVADDVYDYVKRYPLHALAGAAILGFVAGRLLSRD